jgi:5-methylcytosine-specific restriction endonuclease McrA
MDYHRVIRKVERITGCTLDAITEHEDGVWRPVAFTADDPELGVKLIQAVKGKCRHSVIVAIHRLHEQIYRARREELYRRQRGCCARCKMKTPRMTCHHKKHRGAHGRDDRMENLEMLCTGMGTKDCHGGEHGR